MGGERGSERTRQSGLILHTPLLLTFLPPTLSAASQRTGVCCFSSRRQGWCGGRSSGSAGTEALAGAARLRKSTLFSSSAREGVREVKEHRFKKKKVSSVCLAASRLWSSSNESAFSAFSGWQIDRVVQISQVVDSEWCYNGLESPSRLFVISKLEIVDFQTWRLQVFALRWKTKKDFSFVCWYLDGHFQCFLPLASTTVRSSASAKPTRYLIDAQVVSNTPLFMRHKSIFH